jgi:hypothetical protein
MPSRLQLEAAVLRNRLERGDPLWPAQLAVAAAIGLHLSLSDKILIGPNWMIPAVEGLLLAVLIVVAPSRVSARSPRVRGLTLALICLVTLTYVSSLALLVHYLVNGGSAGGHRLILSGIVLWATNVLIFSVWYWELDRGGPLMRFEGWRPGFVDYLYTSLTNATAFSPTDTMPLSHSAKLAMGLQGTAAIVTIGLVVARAVNILA